MADLEIQMISSFVSSELLNYEKNTVQQVRNAKTKNQKVNIIEKYFRFINKIKKNEAITSSLCVLNEFSKKQMVLYSNVPIDLYKSFFSLKEILCQSSIESIYLLFTYWRITGNDIQLSILLASITEYIRTYYYEFDKDPEMNLYIDIKNQDTIHQLVTIGKWLNVIQRDTEEIFDQYKNINWLYPIDTLADNLITTNQISKFDLYLYRRIFKDDSESIVKQKAICNQGYGTWIKTADVMYIVSQIFKLIKNNKYNLLDKMNITNRNALELYNNSIEVRDSYLSHIFSNRAYYENERQYLDSSITEILEEDEKILNDSINDTINLTHALMNDNIDELLQAKQQYITRLSGHISKEQQRKLDDYIEQIIENLKVRIKKLDIYEELYKSVSNEFKSYSSHLMIYPDIFSSLVSAEYLYNQYVDRMKSNDKFDYSCISIMYYMSLEDFVNKLIYTPYSKEVLINVDKRNWKGYVSHNNSFWDNKTKSYKKACEIGNLGFLLKSVDEEEYFKNFLYNKFNSINIQNLKDYGERLYNVSPRRNEAAHGGNIISYLTVKEDKNNVYNKNISSYKGLILELLEILFAK